MARKEGSFGVLGLLVIMGIVLFLVARNWKAVAPQVLPGSAKSAAARGVDAPSIDASLPDAREKTDVHADDVQSAMTAAE
jgi:hypothetical protein